MTIDCTDHLSEVIDVVIVYLKKVFAPDAACAVVGGGSTIVRLFACETTPLASWDANAENDACAEPFLWVRLAQRYRSKNFPEPMIDTKPCSGERVAELEIGVGRCTSLEAQTDWAAIAQETEVSIDDSWRIETALCAAAAKLSQDGHNAATDTVVPYGPEGGITAWSGIIYVSF